MLGRLAEGAPRVAAAGEARAARLWVELIHDTVARLVAFSLDVRRHAGGSCATTSPARRCSF